MRNVVVYHPLQRAFTMCQRQTRFVFNKHGCGFPNIVLSQTGGKPLGLSHVVGAPVVLVGIHAQIFRVEFCALLLPCPLFGFQQLAGRRGVFRWFGFFFGRLFVGGRLGGGRRFPGR